MLYFVADPTQPLDRALRATLVRVASTKTEGEFDVNRPFVAALTWDGGDLHFSSKPFFDMVGKKVSSEEDVSQLLEKLKISPGGGHLSDGTATICVGQSDV